MLALKFVRSTSVQVNWSVLSLYCKNFPSAGLLLTFNLASLTESDCNLASDTVLSLGVPIDVAAPIKVTNQLEPLGRAVQNFIPLVPSI